MDVINFATNQLGYIHTQTCKIHFYLVRRNKKFMRIIKKPMCCSIVFPMTLIDCKNYYFCVCSAIMLRMY